MRHTSVGLDDHVPDEADLLPYARRDDDEPGGEANGAIIKWIERSVAAAHRLTTQADGSFLRWRGIGGRRRRRGEPSRRQRRGEYGVGGGENRK
jgi:hypothetical protein